ncbi:single-stranded DNA-binding protein [Dactylosporangium sp. AC04546]|uniref:single-stranded DNA-binding protein n=1 Tax=Dactylosporangium sp. AC04546 TaxID=2862460 RepID=UPI001EDCDE58|nr:single-stranded DNA-binding protein [Dactylosporangium sp. AC04546]WVK84955.1 single-stranded DNA-binding protein [Dactylosporangium sp. AC04546]
MFDTTVTIVGNVLNPPDARRLVDSQALVTHFKVAAHSRKFDRAGERWVDGDSLRVRVNCWRQLADNVARSVNVGDPVIVTGRLYSRDWEGDDHVKRVSYELDAFSVGHDLARGRSKFARIKASTQTSSIDDEQADRRIGEAPTEPAPEVTELPRRREYDGDLGGYVTLVDEETVRDPFAEEVLAELAESLDPVVDSLDPASEGPLEDPSEESSDEEDVPEPAAGRRRRSRRVPVPV